MNKLNYIVTWKKGNAFCETMGDVAELINNYHIQNCMVFKYTPISDIENRMLDVMIDKNIWE